jgi:hypothetical protein
MKVVEKVGPEVLEPFGGVGECLFKSVATDIDMADDPAVIRLEGGFTFYIEGCRRGCRIGAAFGDGISEELEDIVVLPTFETAGAILDLTERIEMQATAADDCQGPYQNIPHQALVGERVLKDFDKRAKRASPASV